MWNSLCQTILGVRKRRTFPCLLGILYVHMSNAAAHRVAAHRAAAHRCISSSGLFAVQASIILQSFAFRSDCGWVDPTMIFLDECFLTSNLRMSFLSIDRPSFRRVVTLENHRLTVADCSLLSTCVFLPRRLHEYLNETWLEKSTARHYYLLLVVPQDTID